MSLFKVNIGACIIEDFTDNDDEDGNPIEQERKVFVDFSNIYSEQTLRRDQRLGTKVDSLYF
jgi:hypothetical protein